MDSAEPSVSESKLKLQLADDPGIAFRLDLPAVEGYILGRSDSQSIPPPDIDLAQHNARERGVSRRHAAIVYFQGGIHILDLDSVNGTFVNNRRLPPESPYNLTNGDRVTLGDLEMLLTIS